MNTRIIWIVERFGTRDTKSELTLEQKKAYLKSSFKKTEPLQPIGKEIFSKRTKQISGGVCGSRKANRVEIKWR